MRELDVEREGRTVHAYDLGGDGFPVFWLHGTPNIGTPPAPLFAAARRLGLRWLGYDRPGYGGSTPRPGRTVASAAGDVAAIADALGLDRFAVMGHSGGGPNALACGALLGDRVRAVVCGAGLAPFGADGLDWFAGMGPGSEATLRAATHGRAAKEAFEETAAGEPDFAPADWEALQGEWGWFGTVVEPGLANGIGPLIDDDMAFVSDWGCAPADVRPPTLYLHGAQDRIVPSAHGEWLAAHTPDAELRIGPDDGHISILRFAPTALEWMRAQLG